MLLIQCGLLHLILSNNHYQKFIFNLLLLKKVFIIYVYILRQDITKFFLLLCFIRPLSSSLMHIAFIYSILCFHYDYRIVYKSKNFKIQNKTRNNTNVYPQMITKLLYVVSKWNTIQQENHS